MTDPDDFSEDERSTANLRLQSTPPLARVLLGLVAFVPRAWRGVVVLSIIGAVVYLLTKLPALVSWLKGAP